MRCRGIQVLWLVLAVGVIGESPINAQSPRKTETPAQPVKDPDTAHHWLASIPLERLTPKVREGVERVLEQPTISAHGPAEVFRARPSFYRWLLEHPDRAVQMWHRLGARCLTITDRGAGRFGWADGQGTDIAWQTIFSARRGDGDTWPDLASGSAAGSGGAPLRGEFRSFTSSSRG